MRVRTIRTHFNRYGDSYEKNGSAGPVYEAPDAVAKNLISAGYVEKADKPKKSGASLDGSAKAPLVGKD